MKMSRKLDGFNFNRMSQVFYAPAERGQEDTATSEAKPTVFMWSEAQPR
jgi:hypothetical protein